MTTEKGAAHTTAAQLLGLLRCSLAHLGWLSTSELASRLAVELPGKAPSRDLVRRLLVELVESGMMVTEDSDDGARWRLGPVLAQIGRAHEAYLAVVAGRLRAEAAEAAVPHGYRRVAGGSLEWRPLPSAETRDAALLVDLLRRAGRPVPVAQMATWTDSRFAQALDWATTTNLLLGHPEAARPPLPLWMETL